MHSQEPWSADPLPASLFTWWLLLPGSDGWPFPSLAPFNVNPRDPGQTTGVAALGLSQVLCLLGRGDYSCPCQRADELLTTIISFAQCCSVTLCGQRALGTCLFLPVFSHLLVKKLLSGFPQLPQHRRTRYFTASLGFALAPSQRAAEGCSAQSKAWISLLGCTCYLCLPYSAAHGKRVTV